MTLTSAHAQSALPGLCQIKAAYEMLAAANTQERGAIFTRREVVEFILDLSGYTADRPLHQYRLLEPSMGQGDFLTPIIDRLFVAYDRVGGDRANAVSDLADCLCAIELHHSTYEEAFEQVRRTLQTKGLNDLQANALCRLWLKQGDFLLLPFAGTFTHVIGNPPYIRQELIPDALMAEYRRRFTTIYDRADIYIPFIERSLSLLAPGGTLGFICADRWMKNRYGGPLRRFIADQFYLRCFVDMVDTDAFLSDVIAYPAIIVVDRSPPAATRVAYRPSIESEALKSLAHAMNAPKLPKTGAVSELVAVTKGADPWMLSASDQLEMVRRLEGKYPTLEEAGCSVGIGVATGADRVFIGAFDALDVEPDRKLPLVMTRDILKGRVEWQGYGVINPFGADGKLVALSAYPKLAAHLERHGAAIKARHVSKKNPGSWYRTIDRIYPQLAKVPKLLIPDIKGSAHIVYEPGGLYPHHNLYYVTSSSWDLRALQAVLLSDITHAFMLLYSTKMRGGYLRFQAQYLRRLRIPHWADVPTTLRDALVKAATTRDAAACNEAAAMLYQLTAQERQALTARNEVADVA